MQYNPEQVEEQKAAVFRAISLSPNITVLRLQKTLEENGMPLSREYVTSLVSDVRKQRAQAIAQQTKEEIMAEFQEVTDFCIQQLRMIASEELYAFKDEKATTKKKVYAQKNRIDAFKAIIEAVEKRNKLKMDLGLLERQLGNLSVDNEMVKILRAVKAKRKAEAEGKEYVYEVEASEATAPLNTTG